MLVSLGRSTAANGTWGAVPKTYNYVITWHIRVMTRARPHFIENGIGKLSSASSPYSGIYIIIADTRSTVFRPVLNREPIPPRYHNNNRDSDFLMRGVVGVVHGVLLNNDTEFITRSMTHKNQHQHHEASGMPK